METHPPAKKNCVQTWNIKSCYQNYVWLNFEQTSKSALFKKVAVLNWGKDDDFTVQPLPLLNFSLKKDISLYVKHFGMNKIHKIFGFVNSQKILMNN